MFHSNEMLTWWLPGDKNYLLASPFWSLFNQALSSGIMPSFYKAANVFPVPKKGYLSLASKHRPISLLNSESKAFEKTIFKHLKIIFKEIIWASS